MPVTICAATRPESPVVVVKANEVMVKTAEPRQTSVMVRRPAGFSRRCRSSPRNAPHRMANRVRAISTKGLGRRPHKLSHNQEIFIITLPDA